MSKSPIDPKNYDYNRDNRVTESDWDIGKKDLNKDGQVTPKEERKYNRQQNTTTTKTTTGPGGEVTSETTVPSMEEETPRWSRQKAAAAGFTREFLRRNPDIIPLLKEAIKFNYSQEEFNQFVRTETEWGKSTTESERKFDLEFYGQDPTTIKNTLTNNREAVAKMASDMGVTLSPQDLKDFSYRYTRSGLTTQDIYDFISSKYETTAQAPIQPTAGAPSVGTASQISDKLRDLARSYGVTMTADTLTAKVREGIKQGANWESWVEGQRNIFRQNAKNLYPSASDQLDNYTLDELLNPYLEDASAMLGIRREHMDISNPMWSVALSGVNGKAMNRDEWLTTLRTDRKYGYRTTNMARKEASDLTSGVLRAFGVS